MNELHRNCIVSWNCNSLSNKLNCSIPHYLDSYSPLVLTVQESRPRALLNQLSAIKSMEKLLSIHHQYNGFHAPHPLISNLTTPSSDKLLKKKQWIDTQSDNEEAVNSGGICFFIRKDVMYDELLLNQYNIVTHKRNCHYSQLHWIQIKSPVKLILGSIYINPNATKDHINNICDKIKALSFNSPFTQQPIILLGDMNAKHPYWHQNKINTAGAAIYNLLHNTNSSPLYLLNNLYPNANSIHTRATATIDLAIANEFTNMIEDVTICQDVPLCSDHLPIAIELQTLNPTSPNDPGLNNGNIDFSILENRWKGMIPFRFPSLKNKNKYKQKWQEYKNKLKSLLKQWTDQYPHVDSLNNAQQINDSTSLLSNIMIDAALSVFGVRGNKKEIEWWYYNVEAKAAIHEYHCMHHKYQRHRNEESLRQYRQTYRNMKKTIANVKRKSWCEFQQQLYAPTQHGYTAEWNIWKRNALTQNKLPLNSICNNVGQPPATTQDALENLCSHYETVGDVTHIASPPPIQQQLNELKERMSVSHLPIVGAVCTIEEIRRQCKTIKSTTTTGPDNVPAVLVKHGGTALHQCLHTLLNGIWKVGHCPSIWKYSNVLSLFKKGNKRDPNNYRPISLTPVLARMVERLVKPKLVTIIESKLHPLQFGFRAHKSTEHNLFHLLHHIQHTFNNPDKFIRLPVAFLDITKAFDKVDHLSLLLKLDRMGITPDTHLFQFIHSFLKDRKFRTFDGNYEHFSSWHIMQSGVPQGSVLGPLLFLVYINDLADKITNSTDGMCLPFLFADDISIVPDHKKLYEKMLNIKWLTQYITPPTIPFNVNLTTSEKEILMQSSTHWLQVALDCCSQWAVDWKMNFGIGESKSAVVLFRANKFHHNNNSTPIFTLQQQILPYTDTYKYVGLVLHCTLDWSAHTAHVLQKANLAVYRLLRMINSHHADFKTTRLLTNVTIRSTIGHAIQFWNPNKQTVNKLNSMLAIPLRRVLRLPASTHVHSVLAEGGIPPMQIMKEFNTIQTMKRMYTSTSLITKQLFLHQFLSTSEKHLTITGQFKQLLNTGGWYDNNMNDILIKFSNQDSTFNKELYQQYEDQCKRFYIKHSNISTNWIYQHRHTVHKHNHHSKSLQSLAFSTPHYLLHDEQHMKQLRARLRFNRATFKDRLHLYNKIDDPTCDLCDDSSACTMQHILIHCPKFAWERMILEHMLQLSPFRFRFNDTCIDTTTDSTDSNLFTLIDVLLGYIPPMIAKKTNLIKQYLQLTAQFLSKIYSLIPF